METTFFEDAAAQYKARCDHIIIPKRTEGSVRDIMEAHLLHLIESHNEHLVAKIHYLQTGEVVDESIKSWVPFAPRGTAREKQQAIGRLQANAIDLNYVLHNVDEEGICQFTELSQLSATQMVQIYNRMLLQIREIQLPDVTLY
jgi:hypothetical protein